METNKVMPIEGKLLIKADEEQDTKTTSGLIIKSGDSKEAPTTGVIIESSRNDLGLKKGNRIVFGRYTPDEIKVNGQDYLIINVEDVLATIVE
jgi:chaperonin GroES